MNGYVHNSCRGIIFLKKTLACCRPVSCSARQLVPELIGKFGSRILTQHVRFVFRAHLTSERERTKQSLAGGPLLLVSTRVATYCGGRQGDANDEAALERATAIAGAAARSPQTTRWP
jgi:hypothetical protein